MASRFLRDLFPKTVGFDKNNYVLLKDKTIYDTVTVQAADTRVEFFLSKSGKQFTQANFFGDESLVREKNIFMILQISFYPRLRKLDESEWYAVYERGFFEMKVVEPEKVTVDEDKLAAISRWLGPKRTATVGGVDEADAFGEVIDRRTYLVTENKFVPGGRSFQFVVQWPEAAQASSGSLGNVPPGAAAVTSGASVLVNTDFTVEIYGAEYERR